MGRLIEGKSCRGRSPVAVLAWWVFMRRAPKRLDTCSSNILSLLRVAELMERLVYH